MLPALNIAMSSLCDRWRCRQAQMPQDRLIARINQPVARLSTAATRTAVEMVYSIAPSAVLIG